jgi:hypothetical protein
MSEKQNEFAELKRLLKVKRHEVPPPGYFGGFSSEVLTRIRAGETGGSQSFWADLQDGADFWGNFLHIIRVRPGVIGAFATTACLFLLAAVVVLNHSEANEPDGLALTPPAAPSLDASPNLALNPPDAGLTVTTNPVSSLQPVSSMFGSSENPLFQPASYTPSNQ